MINQAAYPLFRQIFLEVETTLRLWHCDESHSHWLNHALNKLRQDYFADKVFPALMGPWLAWQALGRENSSELHILGAAHTLFYAFLDLTDDAEDQELDEEFWQPGQESLAINIGTSLLFLSLLSLERLSNAGVPAWKTAGLRQMFCQAGWLLTAGQHRDLTSGSEKPKTVAEALKTITLKTGTSVRLYFQSSARLAGAEATIENHLGSLGECIGILSQIRGDYQNIFNATLSTDLRNRCLSLPIVISRPALSSADQDILDAALSQASRDQAAHTVIRHLLRKANCRQLLNHWLEHYRSQAQSDLEILAQAGLNTLELQRFLQRLKPLE